MSTADSEFEKSLEKAVVADECLEFAVDDDPVETAAWLARAQVYATLSLAAATRALVLVTEYPPS